MSHHPLDNLCGPGKALQPEAPDTNELAGLLRSGHARLKDARNTTRALESRFDLAYNAAHFLCLAALRRMGYRAGNRYIVFQVLPHTLGLGPEVWRVLVQAHRFLLADHAKATTDAHGSSGFRPSRLAPHKQMHIA